MRLLADGEVDRDRWNCLLNESNYASPFQDPRFYDLFNSLKGYSSRVFAAEEEGVLTSLVVVTFQAGNSVKGYFSRRAIIYGGPLIADNKGESLRYLLRSVSREIKGKAIYAEVRNLFDYSDFKDYFLGSGWNYIPYLNFIIDCRSPEVLNKKMSSGRRRQIQKAVKAGAAVSPAENIKEVEDFYFLLRRHYKIKVRKPLLPWEFFSGFFKAEIGKFLLVKYNGQIIGGMVCPVMDKRAVYEMYICGLDDKYKEQYPGVMATWGAMQYASENNIPVFDFMGAGQPDKEYGVRDFKARFGGEMVEYGRFHKIYNPALYFLGRTAIMFMSFFRR